jgi:hypothetical protein
MVSVSDSTISEAASLGRSFHGDPLIDSSSQPHSILRQLITKDERIRSSTLVETMW